MKRPIRARLPILITANVLGALLALVAILGAISVLAGPAAAPQLVTIPDCGDCNVIVVAKDGGNFTDPIAAMAHIDGQTPDASNRYLLYIGPGTYLLSEPLQMLEYVDIQGAGEGVTILTRGGSGTHPQTDSSSATVSGANSAELRYLTVENIGGLAFAIGIHSNGTSPKLSHVTASVFGATSVNYGLYNVNASPVMTFVTALASGGDGTNSYGLSNNSSSSPRMTNVTVSASGSTNNLGVSNSTSSSPRMTNVSATATGGTNSYGVSNDSSSPQMTIVTATASGATNNYAVRNTGGSPEMTNVGATAAGGTNSIGVLNVVSSATIRGGRIEGSGATNFNYGIRNLGSTATVIVNASHIIGATASIRNVSAFTTRVSDLVLEGGEAPANSGVLTCADSFDETLTPLEPNCLLPPP